MSLRRFLYVCYIIYVVAAAAAAATRGQVHVNTYVKHLSKIKTWKFVVVYFVFTLFQTRDEDNNNNNIMGLYSRLRIIRINAGVCVCACVFS